MSFDAPSEATSDAPSDAPSDALDFRNLNLLWASVMVETLYRLGLKTAVICPGSRSAPLTVAFAQHTEIEAIPVLDERSASFFALGIARRSHSPVALVCTSGTAGANFYGAVIEAKESGVPLLILTADRPPELRQCHAGQAIDQIKIFGQYPNWQAELALPEAQTELFAYLRQTIVQAWERSQHPAPGPIHLNIPLRDPLAPLAEATQPDLKPLLDAKTFFAGVRPPIQPQLGLSQLPNWSQFDRGLIIVGLSQPENPTHDCQTIAYLAKLLNWPVLTDALNPLRNFQSLNPNLICYYDQILRSPQQAQALQPNAILRIGELPTSKVLRQWLAQQDCPQWIVSDRPDNFDPLHNPTTHLRTSLSHLGKQFTKQQPTGQQPITDQNDKPNSQFSILNSQFLQTWQSLEQQAAESLAQTFQSADTLIEPKIAWFLSQHLPPDTPLFIANSTPIRDMEWFWQKGDRRILPYVNRGANGIDGTLSTAIGIAQASQRPSVMLTGDLALLHDTNGFLVGKHLLERSPDAAFSLTIVLINNNGGGIFELLPISQFNPPFEEFFATPQGIEFGQLCQTYGVSHCRIEDWKTLQEKLEKLPSQGIQILEVVSDRKRDAAWRSRVLKNTIQKNAT